jgi:hypothetical protein
MAAALASAAGGGAALLGGEPGKTPGSRNTGKPEPRFPIFLSALFVVLFHS